METKIIKIGTSLGMIVPGNLAKELKLELGSKIELLKNNNEEFVARKKPNAREGWDAAFAKYAQEGEDAAMLPDILDSEADQLL